MRTITKEVFTFEELSKESKEKVIETQKEFIYINGFDWHYEYMETLEAFSTMFNIKINAFSDDLTSFSFLDDKVSELKGIRLKKYIINNFLYLNKYNKTILDEDCFLTGFCADIDILKPIIDFLKDNTKNNISFEVLIYECLHSFKKAYNNDCNNSLSDERIVENIKANEYEFYSNGEIF